MDDGNLIPCYKRVLLKLSGEALKGTQSFGISDSVIADIVSDLKYIHRLGVQVAVVIGGGNFFRGDRSNNLGIERTSADYIGMLSTVINGIALRDILEKNGIPASLISALKIQAIAESYDRIRAVKYLESGRIVIFSAGTGNPFFTTDTAAALRAVEIRADVLLKATMVDGVYSDDPKKVKNSVRFDHISYNEVITRELKVMDIPAVALCKENHLPIKIFDSTQKGNLITAITEKNFGTSIS